MHGLDGSFADRAGHIADTHTDYIGFGMLFLIFVDALSNL